MSQLYCLALVQAALLTIGQVLLKISLQSFGRFEWSWRFFAAVFTNLRFARPEFCRRFAPLGLHHAPVSLFHGLSHREFELCVRPHRGRVRL